MQVNWHGVIPAITTPFDAELAVDHAFLAHHAAVLIDARCVGVVAVGCLGEAATLTDFERVDVVRTLVAALGERAPVLAGIAASSTAQAVTFARDVAAAGAAGLMMLPPYVYVGDERETQAHVAAVIAATDLPCMLYNNPVAYGADFRPEHVARLAEAHPNLVVVKESSTDVRRVTAIRAPLGERLQVLVGVDDAIVEGVAAGAVGWIAGLSTRSRAGPWPCSSSPAAAGRPRRPPSTAGSCRCCGSTPCPSSSSSSSWRRSSSSSGTTGSGRRAWS